MDLCGTGMDLTIRTYFDVQNGIDLTNLQAGSKYAKHEPSIPEYPNSVSFETVYVYL